MKWQWSTEVKSWAFILPFLKEPYLRVTEEAVSEVSLHTSALGRKQKRTNGRILEYNLFEINNRIIHLENHPPCLLVSQNGSNQTNVSPDGSVLTTCEESCQRTWAEPHQASPSDSNTNGRGTETQVAECGLWRAVGDEGLCFFNHQSLKIAIKKRESNKEEKPMD